MLLFVCNLSKRLICLGREAGDKMNSLKLKAARVGKGLNQTEAAQAIETTTPTYCNKENGKKAFTTKEIEALAKVLNLNANDVDEIFFDGNLSKRLNCTTDDLKESA
jgi:DNA-binding XRE family transcriptional regulator